MCGITALFDPACATQSVDLRVRIDAMTDAIAHRGPDGRGVWMDTRLPLALGHRRLAIVDLTADGAQPMQSLSGRYVTVFNGEIYNFLDLRHDLESEGHVFKGRSDTEIMLAAIDRWGLNRTLPKLNGMFAIILWNREQNELHLIRDRMGKKPLYVGWAGPALLMASELKSFHTHPAFVRRVRAGSVSAYVQRACVPAPLSIFEQVWTLMPGCRMMLRPSEFTPGTDLAALMEPYWNPGKVIDTARARRVDQAKRPMDDLIREGEGILERCVQQRMMSDVPLGAFLSGGIDSSLVVALMQKKASAPVKTYSIGFADDQFDESRFARTVANHLETDHHELILSSDDARAVIPLLPQIYDEPFADASQIPTYLVSHFARRDVTVALSGDGGDEMLGGYRRHAFAQQYESSAARLPAWLRHAGATMLRSMPDAAWQTLLPHKPHAAQMAHKAATMLQPSTFTDLYNAFLGFWSDPADILHQHVQESSRLDRPLFWPDADLRGAERVMLADTLSYLPDDILVKVDRASMAVSLEARAPLLDMRFFDFCWSLPFEAKLRAGRGKWLLREILARHVPRPLFERPKQGFYLPIGDWLRGPLREWAGDLLHDPTLRADGWFDPIKVRAAFDRHDKGLANLEPKLWIPLMYQAWRLHWLESNAMEGVSCQPSVSNSSHPAAMPLRTASAR